MIDLRLLSFATLMKKLEKTINNEKTKEEIRKGTATYKFADYAKVMTKDYTSTHYIDKKGNEISQSEIIANYCKENDIEIVKDTKENYSIEIVPSEKAIKEFNRMFTELEGNQHRNIAKVASQIKHTRKGE